MRTRYRFRNVAVLYVLTVAVLALLGATMPLGLATQLAVVLTLPAGVVLHLTPLLLLVVDPGVSGAWAAVPVVVLSGLAAGNALVVGALLRRWEAGGTTGAEVERRLTDALLTVRLPVTAVAGRRGVVRSGPGEIHRQQSLLLRDLTVPVDVLFDRYREVWAAAGHRVSEQTVGGRTLRAYDRQGYELLLVVQPLDVVLQVTSPVVRGRGFLPGMLAGAVPQGLLLVSIVGLSVAAAGGREWLGYVLGPLVLGVLVLGAASAGVGLLCLLWYATRPFGRGLLFGVAPGLAVVLGYLSTMG